MLTQAPWPAGPHSSCPGPTGGPARQPGPGLGQARREGPSVQREKVAGPGTVVTLATKQPPSPGGQRGQPRAAHNQHS